MTLPLPSGSVRPEVANATLDLLRQLPEARRAAVAVYERLLPIANTMLAYSADPMSQLVVRSTVQTQERIISQASGTYGQRPYEWAHATPLFGHVLSKTLDDYWAGRFDEDDLRHMVFGAVRTYASATPAQRDRVLTSLRDAATWHLPQIIDRWGRALHLTGAQIEQLSTTGTFTASPPPGGATPGPAPIVGPVAPSSNNPAPTPAAPAPTGPLAIATGPPPPPSTAGSGAPDNGLLLALAALAAVLILS